MEGDRIVVDDLASRAAWDLPTCLDHHAPPRTVGRQRCMGLMVSAGMRLGLKTWARCWLPRMTASKFVAGWVSAAGGLSFEPVETGVSGPMRNFACLFREADILRPCNGGQWKGSPTSSLPGGQNAQRINPG